MASRKEQKEQLRQERLQREQQEQQAAARKRLIGFVVAGILVLGIVGALAAVVLSGGDDDGGSGGGGGGGETAAISYPDGGEIPEQQQADLKRAAKAAGCELETLQAEGAGDHTTEPVEYETEPPALGPHYPDWPDDGIYEEAPEIERVVHTLEHGRILIWIRPDATEEQLAQLKALYDEDPYHVIMLPREQLKEPVAVSAWVGADTGHILRCDEINDKTWDAIRSFKTEYRDKGPEFVP